MGLQRRNCWCCDHPDTFAANGSTLFIGEKEMFGKRHGQVEPPVPPKQVHDLPSVAQGVPPAFYMFSQLLTVVALRLE